MGRFGRLVRGAALVALAASCGGSSGGTSAADGGAADAGPTTDASAPDAAPIDRWTTVGPLTIARSSLAAAPVTDRAGPAVLAIGGADDRENVYGYVELFAPTTRAWTFATDLDVGSSGYRRTGGAACPVTVDNVGGVLFAGGAEVTGLVPLADAFFYDPWKKAWSALAPMSTARGSFAAAPVTVGGVAGVLAVGGDVTGTSQTSAEVFLPTTKAWTTVAPMPTGRSRLAAAPVTIGAVAGVLVVGGTSTNALAVAEFYDPTSNTWRAVAPMSTPRAGAAAAPVTIAGVAGVLVMGGAPSIVGGGSAPVATAEFYDPTTNTWRAKASMSSERMDLAAAPITIDGVEGVLAVGGQGLQGATLASAEFYAP